MPLCSTLKFNNDVSTFAAFSIGARSSTAIFGCYQSVRILQGAASGHDIEWLRTLIEKFLFSFASAAFPRRQFLAMHRPSAGISWPTFAISPEAPPAKATKHLVTKSAHS